MFVFTVTILADVAFDSALRLPVSRSQMNHMEANRGAEEIKQDAWQRSNLGDTEMSVEGPHASRHTGALQYSTEKVRGSMDQAPAVASSPFV
jgi:hypothetical protein